MTNNKPLISIVVPVYNVELYLRECVESLINQSYPNLEIVLVDDSSTDSSLSICREYQKKDTRIKVLHKQNGGAASARNYGLDSVSGDYICLIDSDDIVASDYVEKLLSVLINNQADIAVCSFVQYYRNGKEKNPITYPVTTISQVDYLERFLSDWTCGIAWNKMFKSEILKHVRYSEGHKIDDEFFTYLAVMKSKRVAIFDDTLYFYRMRASSVMSQANTYQERIIMDNVAYSTTRYENIKKFYPELKIKYLRDLADKMIRLYQMSIKFPKLSLVVRKYMCRYLPEILISKINWKLKVVYLKSILLDYRISHNDSTLVHHGSPEFEPFA